MSNEKPRFDLKKTVYEMLKEARFVCEKCQCPIIISWEDCPNCGHVDYTER